MTLIEMSQPSLDKTKQPFPLRDKAFLKRLCRISTLPAYLTNLPNVDILSVALHDVKTKTFVVHTESVILLTSSFIVLWVIVQKNIAH